MKTLKIFPLIALFISLSAISVAQKTKTESIPVSGNCGMCKAKIEKAAKAAGVKEANWNAEKKMLTVKYSSGSTNAAKIQQAVAVVGYDTRDIKANDEAYGNLHSCCQYDRTTQEKNSSCCNDKCEMKDGKCADMAACKDKDCCNADGVCNAGTERKHEGSHEGKAECCKKSN